MERRRFIEVIAGGLLAAPLAAEGQQAGKVYRVGILGEKASDPSEARLWQAFRLELGRRGWIEGKNILIESRWAEDNAARLPELAADLVRLKVDLIVTRGSTYVQGARTATSSIPIVFTMHANPVGAGHVASLARPGGNITGLSDAGEDTEAKRLELLKTTDPRIKRVAVLWNPGTPSHPPRLKAVEAAARQLHLQLQPVVARNGEEVESAFAAMARAHAQAALVISYGPYIVARERMAELAIRYRLPTFSIIGTTWRRVV